jgi:FkbH-like protein
MRAAIERGIAHHDTFPHSYSELKEMLMREPTLSNYQFGNRLLQNFEQDPSFPAFTRRIRLALLTSYTIDFVMPILKAELMLSDIGADIYKSHYNQFRQEVLNPDSDLYRFNPEVTIVAFNLEDVFPDRISRFPALSDQERQSLSSDVLALYRMIAENFRRYSAGGRLLLQNLVAPFDAYDDLARADNSIHSWIDTLNRELPRIVDGYADTFVLDYARLVNEAGTRTWTDPRTYYMARIPVAQSNWIALGACYATYIRALSNLDAKCIVLDLDNTLWGGVLGEDGFDGIQIGDTYPGIVFKRFQEYLLGLYSSGYILAISSKNNHEDVIDVLRRHPSMILREQHFAAIKANWNSKEQSIREISREIQISCDHMLFIDDNPVEIAKVGSAIPGITCLHLPSPPLEFGRKLESRRRLGKLLITEEDRRRGSQYFQDRQRRETEKTAGSLSDFYRSLKQRVSVHVDYLPHTARMAQLTQRTNQFNMTTIRLTESEVRRMISSPDYMLLTADLCDEFGDSGTIAFIQIRKLERSWIIENWLMSCRVLGRTVEQRLLDYIVERARVAHVDMVFANYAPTKKNRPFADFYLKNGFTQIETADGGAARFAVHCSELAPHESFVEIVEGEAS